MRNRFLLSLCCAGTLAVGLGLSFPAAADSTAPDSGKKQEPAKTKAKPGAACKATSDCDQSTSPQTCQSGKCHVENYPPPAT